jgi:hypothetical protein
VFICYRREDSAPYAGRLHDRLASEFGARSVFMDLDSIDPGEDFDERIRTALARTDVVVAVIGHQWLSMHDDRGTPRVWLADDYVRREIALALESGVHVIPALVGHAELPKPDTLPKDIRHLVALQAVDLSDAQWSQDAARLVAAIDRAAPHAGGWMRVLRSQRSRRNLLFAFSVLVPLMFLGGAQLAEKVFRDVKISQTAYVVLLLLGFGVVNASWRIAMKYLGGERLDR